MEHLSFQENKSEKFNNWIKAPLQKEGGEIERVMDTFYNKKIHELPEAYKNNILDNYEQTQPQVLSEELWSILENSESFQVMKGDYSIIESEIGEKRDWKELLRSFKGGNEMEMPVIAYLPLENKYHLVSGNTRLCIARAEGITPQIIVLEIPQVD